LLRYFRVNRGLVHISEIDLKKVHKVTDYFKEGDKVKVKLLRIEGGKYSLSRKALLTKTLHPRLIRNR
jgi:polyribonucleotide nucleotidyltransferase